MSSTSFPKADAFKSLSLGAMKCKAVPAIAYTGQILGNQLSVLGPSPEGALLAAHRVFGPHFEEKGAQRVVVMREDKFHELLALAGIEFKELA